jgi:hypothetical protein
MGILRKAKEFGIHLVVLEVVKIRLFAGRGPGVGGRLNFSLA